MSRSSGSSSSGHSETACSMHCWTGIMVGGKGEGGSQRRGGCRRRRGDHEGLDGRGQRTEGVGGRVWVRVVDKVTVRTVQLFYLLINPVDFLILDSGDQYIQKFGLRLD
ncbi:hypothetical protein GALMADRAFT_739731 [Galerina marginata CBS 339.88]|uniref:Uncharacterized protein n=1 Tax=Galerina marginata (strain CBS 339.88) TaxID=685588 RepID=A0A067SS65_GALM3|nr:hypothetical protein GALMADRAFT_739731 [Galerina marginata CBS 339.88]